MKLYAWTDVTEKSPSSGRNEGALDGIRGLAVLIVIASHSHAFGLDKQGGVGVWLFFALSAFLLTLPFAAEPSRALRVRRLLRYAARRLLRILPAYYSMIILTFLFRGAQDTDFLTIHLLFLRGDGIWWAIPQEMLFYGVLPFLAAYHSVVFRRNAAVTAVGLAMLALAVNLELTRQVFSLHGNGKEQPFYLGVFVTRCGEKVHETA